MILKELLEEQIGELLTSLKRRLTDTNLNLRARALEDIGLIAEGVGPEIKKYSSSIAYDVLIQMESQKMNVVQASYFFY